MTERLYYHNSFLYDFVAALEEVRTVDGRTALVLDRTVFYPTSGGQVFDTGWFELEPLELVRGKFLPKLRVTEVADAEDGAILHFVEGTVPEGAVRVRGFVDVDRRRDHMQQHSGQHLLSAAFVELFQMPTVSFHMGEESCTIDLDTKSLTAEQVRKTEARANEVILQDRTVGVHFVSPDKAREMGVRKIPPAERDELRLVEIKDFDLCACGGTHVKSTGQVGSILCRKVEKVKQGFRVEFVSGERAVRTARRDYETLVESGALFSTHVWEVPASIRKLLDENKAAGKAQHRLLEEIAELRAAQMIAAVQTAGTAVIAQVIPDRDLVFVKLLAQKLTQSPRVVALLGAASGQAALVFAQSPGLPNDMGALMKEAMTKLGGRGGGNKDLAQGGVPDLSKLEEAVREAAATIK
ncbi:MAG: DHHA1 domain-containing protein [Terriglobia bacterium]|jgi:alanyl-tRNA synthetase|nr:DHHA1 domain-containing protein [Terriglobia bacterium]